MWDRNSTYTMATLDLPDIYANGRRLKGTGIYIKQTLPATGNTVCNAGKAKLTDRE